MKSALASLLSAAVVAMHSTALSAADADGAWVQLTPAGTFSGRNGLGPWVTGDKTSMEKIVANTRTYAGSTDLAIDYDHQAVYGAVPGVGGKAPAAGWIKELKVQDDGIYGRVEWTEKAATAIRAKEYRYLSPVFLHEKTSGRVLLIRMAGLTNTPNLDLVAVAASALLHPETEQNGESMDKILVALGLATGTTDAGVIAAINALLTSSTAIAKAAGLTETAKPDEILAAVNSIVADRVRFAEAAGLAATAKSEEIVTAVQSAVKRVSPDPAQFVPIAQVTALQTDLKKLQEDVLGDKVTEAVNSAIEAGKVAPSLKEWATDYAKKDLSAFQTFVGNAPVLTKPQLADKKRETGAGETLDEAQLAVCTALGIAPADYRKTIAAEQEAR
ncbi:phage protease [Mesorhizobium sp. M0106]|uniref:phage protease n=1 Tax=Mesorhizobium sp. M0106 TaxID=2956880 RepID=UPI00333CDE86